MGWKFLSSQALLQLFILVQVESSVVLCSQYGGRVGALWRWGWQPGDATRTWSCWHALTSLALPSVILAGCTQWKWCDTHVAWWGIQSKTYTAWKTEGCYTMQGNNTSHSSGRDRSQAHSEFCTFSDFLQRWGFGCFLGSLHFYRKLLMSTTCVHHFRLSKTSLLVILK